MLPEGTAPRQLILDLSQAPGYAAEDFLVAPSNAAAFERIDRWPDWPMPMLVVVGPPGSGKTHLAAMWAKTARAMVVDRSKIFDPVDAASHSAVLMEDCDRAVYSERDLFHFFNLMKEAGGSLVLTARRQPDLWALNTPDLLSRLRQVPCVSISAADQGLMKAVLVKLFNDRQIRIEEDVVAYASLHLDQSLEAVARFVQAVDEAALIAGRRITRPLASRTIEHLRQQDRIDQGPT